MSSDTTTTRALEIAHDLDPEVMRALYEKMLFSRMIEEKMLVLLRQGKVSKWFAGIGQEAIAVGATLALEEDEMIFPMHRNLGVWLSRDIPLRRLIAQWQGKMTGFTKGRDRSFHFGSLEHHTVGMISHLGPQLSLAAGVALSYKLRGQKKVSLAFTGEGGTSEGEFHEALNVAAVWQLPVIFLIENNGYGLSTPVKEQYRCTQLSERGAGYGMKSITIEANDVTTVYKTIRDIAQEIRNNPQPYLVECMTFRQRGHEEASGTKYVPQDLMQHWIDKDPVINYEAHLLEKGILTPQSISELREKHTVTIESALKEANADSGPQSIRDQEYQDLYTPHTRKTTLPRKNDQEEIRFIDAIAQAHDQALDRHQNLVVMGQDIAEYGGVFKITEGLGEKYGYDRVRNTPLCESAIIGIGLGMSLSNIKSIVEMQFADFVTCGFNQIVNNLAKIHYRWGASADVVIRMPCGGGVGAGPYHSQTNEAWFFKTPGLKIVYPSTPEDAKGLLLAAIEDPNPVLFFEHKGLYRKIAAPVYKDYYTQEIGKAKIVQAGTDATIITYGMGVHWALEATSQINESIEIIDLCSLSPLDYETIHRSVIKTHKVLILHEDSLLGGIGGEISAYIAEHLFIHLDAPIIRVGSMDTPVPFAKALEEKYLAKYDLDEKLQKLLSY